MASAPGSTKAGGVLEPPLRARPSLRLTRLIASAGASEQLHLSMDNGKTGSLMKGPHEENRERFSPVPRGVREERLDDLRRIFPEVFGEDGVDLERLRSLLGDDIDDTPERYSFEWAGKRDAIRLLQTPSQGTLAPVRSDSIEFDNTPYVFVEGENLESLKLLRKAYSGRINMIYIDPPYNTGNDFVYPDDFTDPLARYLQLTAQADAAGNLLTSNPETSGRYHSAWLSMMYPRLFLARQLLHENGLILVSIDDHEVHNLRMLMNEVFGETSFVGTLTWITTTQPDNIGRARFGLQKNVEYVLVYSKCPARSLPPFVLKPSGRAPSYPHEGKLGKCRFEIIERAFDGAYARPTMQFSILGQLPREGKQWQIGEETARDLEARDRVEIVDGMVKRAVYPEDEVDGDAGLIPFWSHLTGVGTAQKGKAELTQLLGGRHGFETVKPIALIKALLEHLPADSLVMDFFAGSGTVGHGVMELNQEDDGRRRCVSIQIPEPLDPTVVRERTSADFCDSIGKPRNVAEIGKERLRRAVAEIDGGSTRSTGIGPNGFRCFRLVASNFRQWEPVAQGDADTLMEKVGLFVDPLRDGWGTEGVLWEVAVQEGYALHSRVEPMPGLSQNAVYKVMDPDLAQSFLICLDNEIKPTTVDELGLSVDELFICRDVSLTDDLAANLALQCRLKTI